MHLLLHVRQSSCGIKNTCKGLVTVVALKYYVWGDIHEALVTIGSILACHNFLVNSLCLILLVKQTGDGDVGYNGEC